MLIYKRGERRCQSVTRWKAWPARRAVLVRSYALLSLTRSMVPDAPTISWTGPALCRNHPRTTHPGGPSAESSVTTH
jgi:hypothetical protein